MKIFILNLLYIISLYFCSTFLCAHPYDTQSDSTIIISTNKTIVLVFPDSIQDVDFGLTSDYIDGRLMGNKIMVKAISVFSETTSLIIVSSRGDVYSFNVKCFNNLKGVEEPQKLVHLISREEASYQSASASSYIVAASENLNDEHPQNKHSGIAQVSSAKETALTQSPFKYKCEQILTKPSTLSGYGKRGEKMMITLNSIFIEHGKLYFKVYLENKSAVKFDIGFLKFTKIDRSKVAGTKNESEQGHELIPLYVYNEHVASIEGKKKLERVYVFDKFTIDSSEELLIEAGEELGRMINFYVPSSEVLKAKSF